MTTPALGNEDLSWRTFLGEDRLTPAFPDQSSRYDTLKFCVDTGDYDLIKIQGCYPHARYFSITLYNPETATPIAALSDGEIIADAGSTNPFLPETNRDTEPRNYTLWLKKEGTQTPEDFENLILLPTDINELTVFLRTYLPDDGYDSLGGVSLPSFKAYHSNMSNGILPDSAQDTPLEFLKTVFIMIKDDYRTEFWDLADSYSDKKTLDFHRVDPNGTYSTTDNDYIVATLPQMYLAKVVCITLKIPTYETSRDATPFQGNTDTRYFSISLAGMGLTTTVGTIYDDQLTQNETGYCTLCIGPFFLRPLIEQKGWGFLPWGISNRPVLIYRQLLVNSTFSGSIKNVPIIPRSTSFEEFSQTDYNQTKACHYMGEYCPEANIFSLPSFLQTFS